MFNQQSRANGPPKPPTENGEGRYYIPTDETGSKCGSGLARECGVSFNTEGD
ncbi:hypothetical protein AK972_0830 [Pseudomonas yamanorum]|nr:hypothetical protein AK972_0830 [Pseudomonas yamanorum]